MRKPRGISPIPDPVEDSLRSLKSQLPPPRIVTARADRLALIQAAGGPRTARSIRSHRKNAPESRIPHVFSSIDTQIVIDILANDLDSLIAELLINSKG